MRNGYHIQGRQQACKAKVFGCSGVIAPCLVRGFEQKGISIDAQDRREVRKQRQDKTVNLHSRL